MYHRAMKMKLINVKASTCIYFDVANSDKDPKFKVGDHVRISKCISMLQNVFVIKNCIKDACNRRP